MTKLIGTLAVSAAMIVAPALAIAQDGTEWQTEPAPQATPQPDQLPPAPPAEQPYAPEQQPYAQPQQQPYAQPQQQPYAQPQQRPYAQPQAQVPPGQWVYTQQYGWIWMPYADVYTQVPANGYGAPYAYVYAPAYSCWAWLAAPWIWGIGPWPVFGFYGPVRFAWYGHGWWRYPARWHYAPAPAYAGWAPRPAYRGGFSGARPAYRGAYGSYRGSAYGSYRGSMGSALHGGGAAFMGSGGRGFPRPTVASGGRTFGGGGLGGRPAGGGRGGGHGHLGRR